MEDLALDGVDLVVPVLSLGVLTTHELQVHHIFGTRWLCDVGHVCG